MAKKLLTTLLANSADNKLIYIYFVIFFQKPKFDISCQLSVLETVCMKFQNLFPGKNKNISICRLLKILLRVVRVKKRRGVCKQHKSVHTPSYFRGG